VLALLAAGAQVEGRAWKPDVRRGVALTGARGKAVLDGVSAGLAPQGIAFTSTYYHHSVLGIEGFPLNMYVWFLLFLSQSVYFIVFLAFRSILRRDLIYASLANIETIKTTINMKIRYVRRSVFGYYGEKEGLSYQHVNLYVGFRKLASQAQEFSELKAKVRRW
jgi:hypothetical protein